MRTVREASRVIARRGIRKTAKLYSTSEYRAGYLLRSANCVRSPTTRVSPQLARTRSPSTQSHQPNLVRRQIRMAAAVDQRIGSPNINVVSPIRAPTLTWCVGLSKSIPGPIDRNVITQSSQMPIAKSDCSIAIATRILRVWTCSFIRNCYSALNSSRHCSLGPRTVANSCGLSINTSGGASSSVCGARP